MKEWICAAAGTVGGLIAGLFGGWDAATLPFSTVYRCRALPFRQP